MYHRSIWTLLLFFQIKRNLIYVVESRKASSEISQSGFTILGDALHSHFFPNVSPTKLSSVLKSLAGAQTTFKRLDGISHELYQRTHSNNQDLKSTVGRASRTASRTGSCADALFGCELCSWLSDYFDRTLDYDDFRGWNSTKGTLYEAGGREILFSNSFNYSISLNRDLGSADSDSKIIVPISVVVLYEPLYHGGSGLNHGGIDALIQGEAENNNKQPNTKQGRILIILQDGFRGDLLQTLKILDVEPEYINLDVGLISELACVNGHIWRMAAMVLSMIGPTIEKVFEVQTDNNVTLQNTNCTVSSRTHSKTIHFAGESISGSIAALAAVMMDGCVPLPEPPATKVKELKKKSKKGISKDSSSKRIHQPKTVLTKNSMHAFGTGCTSAITLGSPPCLSPNIKAAFVTSFIHGDDIITRTSKASLERLKQRIDRCINGGFLSNKVGWVSDTFSLTVSNVMAHAHGSEGEEARLSVPGKVFLIRPRRLGGACSIHEIRGSGGREALRAAVLWQLNDVLLSKSLWKHHSLESYIYALDRVDK